MRAPHLQFGQLDQPRADVMIDEAAKSYQAKTVKESRSNLNGRHF